MFFFLGLALAADGTGLVALAELPSQAQALRDSGLDASEVDALLAAVQRAGLAPGDAVTLVTRASDVVREHPPIPGFAAFVDTQLSEGVRGEALIQALEAAHTGEKPPRAKPEPDPAPAPTTAPAPRPTPRPQPAMTRGPGRKRGASGR